jgi:hypothetical protein
MENQTLISEKALKQSFGRFGIPAVTEALRILSNRKATESVAEFLDNLVASTRSTELKDLERRIAIIRYLVQDSSETQGEINLLVQKINGISEPATVPRQTPEAGVIPKGGKNGKS